MSHFNERTPRYVVQHERDDEPTYILSSTDLPACDDDCITFGRQVPIEIRLLLARHVCELLNRWREGTTAPQELSCGIRDPATLNTFELVDLVRRVQALFYLDILGDRESWNPDKEWDGADLLDELAQLMVQHGLAPTAIADAPL